MTKLRLLLGAAAVCVLTTPAFATLQLAVDVDGTVFTDSSTTNSLLLLSQNVGGVVIMGSFSFSGRDNLQISTFSITNTNSTPVSYEAVLSDTGFAPPTTYVGWTGSGSWNTGSNGSSYSFNYYADAANGQGAGPTLATPGTLVGTFGGSVTTDRSTSFSQDGSMPFIATSPYSLTLEWGGTFAPGAEIIGRAQQENGVVPEPSTWALMGVGFVLLAGVGWKKRQGAPAFE